MMIITPEEFSLLIESKVNQDKNNYIEAILDYCNDVGIDPADIAPLVRGPLKEKLRVSFQQDRYLESTASLPA